MSGGLTRLVLRAQGQLPVAEPLLPSRFASVASVQTTTDPLVSETDVPWGEASDETVTSPPRPVPALRPAQASGEPAEPASLSPQTDAAQSPVQVRPVFAVKPRTAIASERVLASPQAVPARDAVSVTPPAQSGAEDRNTRSEAAPARDAVSATPPAQSGAADRNTRSEAALPARHDASASATTFQPARHSAQPAAAPFVPSPRASTAFALPSIAGQTAPARAPDVQISIGRLEVHAALARAGPVRAAPVRRPSLSLADYLAQRK
jgi:hypothetical protein